MSYYNWRTSGRVAGVAPYNRTSPNLLAVFAYMVAVWGCSWLGGYYYRPIAGSSRLSVHAWGAAADIRYAPNTGAPGWAARRDEILSFLIGHHEALGIMAIHDYAGSRIWRRGRGWRANSGDNMGESWATYLHLETDAARWADARPVAGRIGETDPTPDPTPTEALVRSLPTLRRGATGLHVKLLQACLNVHGANLVEDGQFGPATDSVVRYVQGLEGLTVDGIVGTGQTWPVVLGVAK